MDKNKKFGIYVKDEHGNYTIKLTDRDHVLLFDTKEAAHEYAKGVGFVVYCVKYSDWDFGK